MMIDKKEELKKTQKTVLARDIIKENMREIEKDRLETREDSESIVESTDDEPS